MLEKLPPGRVENAAELYDWDDLIQEDRVHRLIYTDPAIFQAEMTNIFGAVWVYLAHESQIARNDDFITTRLGLRPIIVVKENNTGLRMQLRLVAGATGLKRIIREPTVNRPGLALAGFTRYFASRRLQVIGNAESCFLKSLPRDVLPHRRCRRAGISRRSDRSRCRGSKKAPP